MIGLVVKMRKLRSGLDRASSPVLAEGKNARDRGVQGRLLANDGRVIWISPLQATEEFGRTEF